MRHRENGRPRLERHRRDQRHHRLSAGRHGLQGQGRHPGGADHLRRPQGWPGRRLPRQLDAGAAGLLRQVRRHRRCHATGEEPRRHRVHPRGARTTCGTPGVHNFRRPEQIRRQVRQEDLRHRLGRAGEHLAARRSSRRTTSTWASGSWSSPASRRCWPKCPAR